MGNRQKGWVSEEGAEKEGLRDDVIRIAIAPHPTQMHPQGFYIPIFCTNHRDHLPSGPHESHDDCSRKCAGCE